MRIARPIVEINRKPEVRPEFVRADAYMSRKSTCLEKRWPRVSLMACRGAEVGQVCSFVTCDIANEPILIVRSDVDTVRAFHNVC